MTIYILTLYTTLDHLTKTTFYLHLKETEFRYNHRHEDIYKIILKLCRDKPLS